MTTIQDLKRRIILREQFIEMQKEDLIDLRCKLAQEMEKAGIFDEPNIRETTFKTRKFMKSIKMNCKGIRQKWTCVIRYMVV